MATSIQVLFNGQVASTIGNLYDCPDSTTALIKTATFHNTSTTTTETVVVSFRRAVGGTARTVGYAVLAPKETLVVEDLFLEADDRIDAVTTTATTVDAVLMGWEVAA